MKIISKLIFLPFFIAIFNYDLFPVFAIVYIFIFYLGKLKVTFSKTYLKLMVFLFFLLRFASSMFSYFENFWTRISQKNYALNGKFIDIESVFKALSCNSLGDGEFYFNETTNLLTCPHTVSYGPLFEIIRLENNPYFSKYLFAFIVILIVILYSFKLINNLKPNEAFIFSLFVISPPVNFVLERMNFDIFIYICIYITYKYFKNESIRSFVVFLLALLKYYPIFLLIGSFMYYLVNKDYKSIKYSVYYLSAYFYLIAYLYLGSLNLLSQPVRPYRPDRTFGILSEAMNLGQIVSINKVILYLSIILTIIIFSFLLKSKFNNSKIFEDQLSHDLLFMFLILSLFANYDYRLAFLVILMPTILQLEDKVLMLSLAIFIFSSPGLLHSYGKLFQLVENYQFAYLDISFYLLVAILVNKYKFYLKRNFLNYK